MTLWRLICCICVCSIILSMCRSKGGLTAAAEGEGGLAVPAATLKATVSPTDDPAVGIFSLVVEMKYPADETVSDASPTVFIAGVSATLLFPEGLTVESAALPEKNQQLVDNTTQHSQNPPFVLTYRAENNRIDLLADGVGKEPLTLTESAITLPVARMTVRCPNSANVQTMTVVPLSPRLYMYDAQGRLLTLALPDTPLTPSHLPSCMPSPLPPGVTETSRTSYIGYQTTTPVDGIYAVRFLFACPIQSPAANGAVDPSFLAVYPTAGRGALTLHTAKDKHIKAYTPQGEITFSAVNGAGTPCTWHMFTFEGLAAGVTYRFTVETGRGEPRSVVIFQEGW